MTEFKYLDNLVELLRPNECGDSDSDCENSPNIGDNTQAQKARTSPYSQIEPDNEAKSSNIPQEDELPGQNNHDTSWKKTPRWDISYKQTVTASDVFLQMGGKTPATASCENIIVTVDLPKQHMPNIDIRIFETKLYIESPEFELDLPLPQPVNAKSGNAKWDKDKEVLIVTLEMNRELDFVNF